MAQNNQGQTQPKDVCDVKNSDQIIENIKKDLCNDLRDAVSTLREAEGSYSGSREVYKYKKCSYLKSSAAVRFYRDIEIVTGNVAVSEALSIKDKVKKSVDKNTELQKLLKEVAKSMKDVYQKFKNLNDAAGVLKRCLPDTCNVSQRKLLTEKLRSQDSRDWFGETVDCIINLTDSLYHKEEDQMKHHCPDDCKCDQNISDIFCFAADVSGMQSFSNIENLTPLEKALSDSITDFQNNVTTNMKGTADDLTKTIDELLKFQQGSVKLKYDVYEKRGIASGIRDTKNFVCDPDCGEVDCKSLCEQFQDTYCGNKDDKSRSELD